MAAIEHIDEIKPADCRSFGERFSLENIAPLYDRYFQEVLKVHNSSEGWYNMPDNRFENLHYAVRF